MRTFATSSTRRRVAAACAGTALAGAVLTASAAATPGLRSIDQRALQRVVGETAREMHVPGAVVALRTPQGKLTATYGTTQLGTRTRPRTSTYFRIASITKTMTSAMVLQLAQEGRLRLDDPVAKYVPGVPNGENILLSELLEMRSGLFDYTSDAVMAPSFDHDPAKVWTPQELLAISFTHPPNFAPGSDYEYSNTNYALLGLIIEKVDGRPLGVAMRRRLFRPLGLKHTMLPPSTSNALPRPYSHGYLYGSASVITTGIPDPPYTPEFRAAVDAGDIEPTDYTGVNHSFAAAAGGVVSTAGDLKRWIRALVGGRVLNAEYQRIWRQSLKPAGNMLEYGYGINRLGWAGNGLYLHGGETAGFNSEAAHDPANGLTLVVWTNLTVSPAGVLTANRLMLKVLDRVYATSPLAPQAQSSRDRRPGRSPGASGRDATPTR